MRSFKDIIYGWFWKYLTKTGLVMCIDLGGDAPEPDPLIGQAAKQNAELGKEALDFYKTVYETDLKPMQKEQMALAKGLVTDYLTDRQTQRDFAARQNAYYEDTYQPIERRMAQEAMDYDSAGNIARRQGIAAAGVNQQFSNARDQGIRALTRMGVDPNSSAFARANDRLTNAQALASAGAQTGAAFDTVDRGIALRAGVANFGRNMPNTAAQYFGLANQTGGMASNISAQQMEAARANAGMVGQGFNTAISGNQSAGNLMLGDFQGRMQGYQADQQAKAGLMQGLGMLGGMALGAPVAGGGSLFGNFMSSSKDYKEGRREVPDGKALRGLEKLDIESWRYKDGIEDGGRHVGPYAEDFKETFGVGNGRQIHVVDAMGITMKAVQDLAKEVRDLKGERKAEGGRISGPGTSTSDSIPVRLSDGEYVINAKAAKQVGYDFLDRINRMGLKGN